MKAPIDTIKNALLRHRGDDLARAKIAFKGFSKEAMNKTYGFSGQTPAEILAGYEQHEEEIKAAFQWLDMITGGFDGRRS